MRESRHFLPMANIHIVCNMYVYKIHMLDETKMKYTHIFLADLGFNSIQFIPVNQLQSQQSKQNLLPCHQ